MNIPNVKIEKRQRGFDEATFIECFVILNAAGGDCSDDFDYLREDKGLAELNRSRASFVSSGAELSVRVLRRTGNPAGRAATAASMRHQ